MLERLKFEVHGVLTDAESLSQNKCIDIRSKLIPWIVSVLRTPRFTAAVIFVQPKRWV